MNEERRLEKSNKIYYVQMAGQQSSIQILNDWQVKNFQTAGGRVTLIKTQKVEE